MYVSSDTFKEVSPNTVYSCNVKVCCLSNPWTKCKVVEDAFSNCDNLLSNRFIKHFCWLVGIFTLSVSNSLLHFQVSFECCAELFHHIPGTLVYLNLINLTYKYLCNLIKMHENLSSMNDEENRPLG